MITTNTIRLLGQYKFLRGSLAKRLRGISPLRFDFTLLNQPLRDFEMRLFLSRYTLEEIGIELDWARSWSIHFHKRFPLREVEERIRRDSNQWRWYTHSLMTDRESSPEDTAWAIKETMGILK